MPTVFEMYSELDKHFPLSLAENFDNCGLLAGRAQSQVTSVLISLDITDCVIDEAKSLGAQLIVSHHPLFFKNSVNTASDSTAVGRRILSLAENKTAAICMHTNADSAAGGVNDLLAAKAGLCRIENLGGGDSGQLGRIGELTEPVSLLEYAAFVKRALNANGVRIINSGKKCSRVAVGGGACGDFLELAVSSGADTFITADVKYHVFKNAYELGINLIDAGHFATENMICGRFYDIISAKFPDVKMFISNKNSDPTEFC